MSLKTVQAEDIISFLQEQQKETTGGKVITCIEVTQILEAMSGMLFCKYAQAAATPLPSLTG